MGSSSSKPSDPDEPPKLTLTAGTEVRVAPDLLQSLEHSPESDKTRASDLEILIQHRVAAELQRITASTDSAIQSALSSTSDPDPPAGGPDQAALDSHKANLSRQSVQKEIDVLKQKLVERGRKDEVAKDKGVEDAREKVVQCLRVKDRRPLDCWEEVRGFKREVGRLEAGVIER